MKKNFNKKFYGWKMFYNFSSNQISLIVVKKMGIFNFGLKNSPHKNPLASIFFGFVIIYNYRVTNFNTRRRVTIENTHVYWYKGKFLKINWMWQLGWIYSNKTEVPRSIFKLHMCSEKFEIFNKTTWEYIVNFLILKAWQSSLIKHFNFRLK